MRFLKGHGTGNDFVILPDPDGALDLTPQLVAALCDRRFGVGGDGVLRVVRDSSGGADWFMDYRNADGSIAELCGNGVRVFVRYLLSAGLAQAGPDGLPVATRAGVVRAVVRDGDIAVDMGLPKVYGESTATLPGPSVAGPDALPGVAVDCGNPHLVCPLPAGVALDDLDLSRAPGFDAAFYPAGVNVEFSAPASTPVPGADAHVRMRVFERGSGETLSCGTGACAVAAVALRSAGRDAGTVLVDVPGGRLTVAFDGRTCWLSGPAVLVASGEILPSLARPAPAP